MSIAVKKNTAVGVEIEDTEGTYKAPTGTGKFVQTLADGFEVTSAKELLDRNIFTASIGKTTPRVGATIPAGTIPVEARASSTAGAAPEYASLMKAAMGNVRSSASTITTKSSGNTATVLQIDDGDIASISVGDMIMVKQSGAYHVSPVVSKTTGTGTATVTMLVAHPSGDCTDSVVVEKFSTYIVADSGHPTLSISKYIESAVLEKVTGARVKTLSLENFATGQLPSFKFAFEGLAYDRSVTAIPYTPSYDTSLPPIVLDARLYMDGSSIDVNEVSFQLENTLGFQTSIAQSNGRAASRPTERAITGSFNPFKVDNSVANYTKYQANTAFSLFAYAKVPTGVTGQFGNVVCVYMPNCIITDLGEADQDGLLQESITFSANRGTAGTTSEIYIGFI